MRWITGNAADSPTAEQGDPKWRATGGTYKGGGGYDPAYGGGGYLYQEGPSQGAGFRYPQAPIVNEMATFGGPRAFGGGMGGGEYNNGQAEHFFGTSVSSNWGQTADTAGKDYMATLFMRPDTPTGIGTPAWSAPQQMWEGLLQEIRSGRVWVTNPAAWDMLRQKNPAWTPQNIGGAATSGNNVQPGGGTAGTAGGSSTENAIANANAAAAADRAAYWAYQQSLLRQGDQRIAMEAARDAWTQEYQKAGLTGKIGDQDTLEAQAQQAGFTGFFQGNPTLAREQWQDSTEYRNAQAALSQKLAEAGLLGTYEGQATLAKLAQEFQQAEMNRQFGSRPPSA
jgi:hypothetical protein